MSNTCIIDKILMEEQKYINKGRVERGDPRKEGARARTRGGGRTSSMSDDSSSSTTTDSIRSALTAHERVNGDEINRK